MKNLDNSLLGSTNLDESISGFSGLSDLIQKITFTHRYIDGTIQQGKLIDSDGKIVVKLEYAENSIKPIAIMDYYPKDKGFVENDGKGTYYYFEPLPEYKMVEIRRLEKLRDDAILAQKKSDEQAKFQYNISQTKIVNDKRIAEQKRIEFEKQKSEAEAKSELERVQSANAQKQIQDSEKSKKTKIIIGSLSVLVVAFVGLKYLKVI
jgi:hypothetical protein